MTSNNREQQDPTIRSMRLLKRNIQVVLGLDPGLTPLYWSGAGTCKTGSSQSGSLRHSTCLGKQPDMGNRQWHCRDKSSSKRWKLHILWDNGKTTWEPLESIRHIDAVTVAQYAKQNKLLGLGGWRWAKSYVGHGNFIQLLHCIHNTNKK